MEQRLCMLAGHGQLVLEGAEAALSGAWAVQVIDLVGRADIAHLNTVIASPAKPISIWLALRKFKPTHICMIGAVRLSDGDREGLAGFLRGKTKRDGDGGGRSAGDGALSQLSRLLEFATGAKVVGIHEIVGGLLAPAGHIAGPAPDDELFAHATRSMRLARELGRLDAGQAIITVGSRIISIEDIGGTDELIDRVGEYKLQGLAGDGREQMVLTKCRKPGQSGNIDLPAIGPETIERAARAGIATIVVQSQHTLLISRSQLIERADELGISVIGAQADEQVDG